MNKNTRQNSYYKSYNNQTGSFINDPIEAERLAQRQEYLRRKNEGLEEEEETRQEATAIKTKGLPQPKHPYQLNRPYNNNNTRSKSKELTLEEKLDITWKWLSDNFPDLFGPGVEVKPLDVHIVRDIKDHYKKHQLERDYPKDLVIKAALYRYMESPEYLACLRVGTSRYDLHGNIKGKVTREEIKK